MKPFWSFETHVFRDGEAGGAGGAGGGGGGGSGGGGDPWFKGKVDDRIIGTWQNNFPQHINDPAALALAATNSFLEAQKMLGAPASELVRFPNKPDDPNWSIVHKRLGKPDDATAYEFKKADGSAYDATFVEALRQTAFSLNLSKDGAAKLASDVDKLISTVGGAKEAEYNDKITKARADLDTSWGNNKAANMELAKMGAKSLGLDVDMINSLEQSVGYAKVMEMLRGVGARTSEGKLISGNRGNGNADGGPMSREQALARKQELYADQEFVRKFNNGDAQAHREMNAIDTIIANSKSQYAA